MKTILLLTDFSETSENAIRYALQMHKNERCTFYVMYIQDATTYVTDSIISNSSASLYDSLIDERHKELVKFVDSLKEEKNGSNFYFKTLVDFDTFTDAVDQALKSKKIELIVMGTNGATGGREVIFGSHTLQILRTIKCNTLIVPKQVKYESPTTILLPLDTFDVSNGKPMREFADFVKEHKLKVHVVRMDPENDLINIAEEDRHHLNHCLKNENYVYHTIEDIPMEHAVDMYLQTHPIDMMSLFVQKETLLERLFVGSSTTKINKKARVPILIIHS